MFIGHFGVGLGSKKIISQPSLGTLILAVQFLDLLWPIFLILGIERVEIDPGNTVLTPLNFIHYPYTHSLVASLLWSFVFGVVYLAFKKNLKNSIVLGVLVFSHWILDFITHRPDLPLTLSSESSFVGLGLWNYPFASIIIEAGIFIGGLLLYINKMRANNKKGVYVFWSLMFTLVIIHILNMIGPPPPSVDAISYSALGLWLFVFWGYWSEKNWSNTNGSKNIN